MTTKEQVADRLGQCIFRIETNVYTLSIRVFGRSTVDLFEAIHRDIESLKAIKAEVLQEECEHVWAIDLNDGRHQHVHCTKCNKPDVI